MKKMRKIALVMLLVLFVTIVAMNGKVDATSSITADKVVTSTDGSIDYTIKGLTLNEESSYQWAIEKTKNATITNWYDITSPDYEAGKVQISISARNKNQLAVLKATDKAYLTIKEVGGSNILENYELDLTLPLLKTFTVRKSAWYDRDVRGNPAYEITAAYGLESADASFKWEKITDSNIVNKYIDNNHDLSGLNLKGRESFPSLSDTSWKSLHHRYSSDDIDNGDLPAEDGLYYIWFKASDANTKTIYGQAVVEVGEVKKITTTPSGTSGSDSNGSGSTNNGGSTNTGTQNTGSGTSNKKQDTTVAKTILPNTGIGIGIMGAILLIIVLGAAGFAKAYAYRDIK